jgi:hypothetical protein
VKLNVRHSFPCSVEMYWKMYWDERYDAMLQQGSDVVRDLLEERTEAGVQVRRLRFTPKRELPMAVAKLIGSKKLIYEVENRFNPNRQRLDWKVLPTILPGRLVAVGAVTTAALPTGCELRVDGDVSVKVRFLGGKIETEIAKMFTSGYQRNADIGKAWLTKYS